MTAEFLEQTTPEQHLARIEAALDAIQLAEYARQSLDQARRNAASLRRIKSRLSTHPGAAVRPEAVLAAIQEAAASTENNSDVPETRPNPTYVQLVARVVERGQPRRPSGQIRIDYSRTIAARRAVLERAQGRCEYPHCTGMPGEPNRQGEPILDVDHIKDLALGGDDHPLNMIALCPNCHAVKTRGANPARRRRELLAVAKAAHEARLAADV